MLPRWARFQGNEPPLTARSVASPLLRVRQDVKRAVRTVRHHALEWGVDPRRIGVLGFSAGGHLAAVALTVYEL